MRIDGTPSAGTRKLIAVHDRSWVGLVCPQCGIPHYTARGLKSCWRREQRELDALAERRRIAREASRGPTR